jgi:ABC-2 type transport system ATP-binding protein
LHAGAPGGGGQVIEVRDVSKSYGTVRALDQVSFCVEAGEIVGLLGPNGAGKTTMIKILTGYLHPDEGDVLVNDLDVVQDVREVQAQIGYLPETAPLYPELSVQAYLQLIADLREVSEADQQACIAAAVYATGLQDQLVRPIGELSKGYRQRVGLAQAILHRPSLLILDEPTIGLDPTQIVEVRALIRDLARHSTVLFSTHILSEVEALCDRVIILIGGQVRADSLLDEMSATSDAILVLRRAGSGVVDALRMLPGVRGVEATRTEEGYETFRVLGDSDTQTDLCPAVYDLARANDWSLRELRPDVRTLEAVFNELATGE